MPETPRAALHHLRRRGTRLPQTCAPLRLPAGTPGGNAPDHLYRREPPRVGLVRVTVRREWAAVRRVEELR